MQEEQEVVSNIEKQPSNDSIQFPIDPEPFNLRLTMIGILILTTIIGYFIITVVMNTSGFNLIAIFGAIVFGAVTLQLLEKPLKARWPRTRFLTVNQNAITVNHGENLFREIDPRQQVNVFKWYFTVEKRSRVPKGWHVVACALEQDEIYLPVYALIDPTTFEPLRNNFTQLQSKKRTPANNDLRLAGQQRRLHVAESARGLDGSEMSIEDFNAFLSELETQFPRWMPKSNT
ncbi:MAG: hypothetical protein RLP44_27090 [Aggregatilineales bacterium]